MRRRRALYYFLSGLEVGEICEKTASDYEYSTRTIKRDLDKIKEWFPSMFYLGLTKLEAYQRLDTDLGEYEAILWRISDSENLYARIAALGVIQRILGKRIKLMKELGFFEKDPTTQRIQEYLEEEKIKQKITEIINKVIQENTENKQ